MIVEQRLKENNIELPIPVEPSGNYKPYKRVGNLLYFSGQGPFWNNKPKYYGKVGKDLTKEEGYEAARLSAIDLIATLKDAIGDLDSVKQFVNIKGYVNSADDFYDQPYVINGFSDTIMLLFGEKGEHSRCALATNTLPLNMAVEVEMIVEVE